MRLYALVEAGDPEAVDVFLTEEDAQRALVGCLKDEPSWRGRLWVEEVELPGARTEEGLKLAVDHADLHQRESRS